MLRNPGPQGLILQAALCACLLCAEAGAETVSFQQGVDGYAGTEDLHLAIPANYTGNGHGESEFQTDPENPRWEWDGEDTWGEGSVVFSSGASRVGSGDNVGLLRFRDVFGDGPGQVPPGAQISSAILELEADHALEGDPGNLHRVLVDWDESTRWSSFGPLPGPGMGTDYAGDIEATTGTSPPGGGPIQLDVTASLQAWSDAPETNRGWAFLPVGAQDTISIQGSDLDSVTRVSVDLEILTPARGELVVTLRKGSYLAVLLDRIGRSGCTSSSGITSDDLDITLDDAAVADVHDSGPGNGLTGSWRPDASCVDLPLCTDGGTGGLCGGPASGAWVLTVTDEWIGGGSAARLVSWGLTLGDGIHPDESYTSSPQLTIPKRHQGANETRVHSSESPVTQDRPRLTVTFEPTVAFSPVSLEASPAGGTQSVEVRIPPGSNALGPVSVSVASDAPGVASPVASPLLFPQGGVTAQLLQLAIGSAGSATLTTQNDAGIDDAALPVTIATGSVTLGPAAVYLGVGSPGTSIDVAIPPGSNAADDVSISLASSEPTVANPTGAVGGLLPLVFAAGGANVQPVSLELGGAPGSATLAAIDDAGTLGPGLGQVVLSPSPPIEYDVNVEPYVQIGDPAPGAAGDQLVIAWQTITRAAGGPNADAFELEYRQAGDSSWIAVPLEPPIEYGSTSRLNHSGILSDLALDTQYEYRLAQLRNGAALASHSAFVDTRPAAEDLRFTAFGNSGQGSPNAHLIGERLALLDPDLHLLLGDMVYNLGEYEHHKPRINLVYGDTMKSRPFVATVGNHEQLTDAGRPVLDHFYLPRNGPPGLDEQHYSFDRGGVHFASINSALEPGDIQAAGAWLEADLAASSQRWKVVYTHEPPLTLDPYGIDRQQSAAVRDHILSVAVEQGADLFLAGAVHSYQRYLPVTSVLAQDPWVEWSSCPAGPGTTLIYPGTGAWTRLPPGPVPLSLAAPMQIYEPRIGIGLFQGSADTLTATFLGADGSAIDSVVLRKCPTPQDCPCIASCGDGFAQAPEEECDDANMLDGDGCSASCRYETIVPLFGTAALGGTVQVTLGGASVTVTTAPGQLPAEVAAAIALAVRFDPSMIALGIDAIALGNEVRTGGALGGLVITDPGLSGDLPPRAIPLLSPWARLALGVLLVAGTLTGVSRARARDRRSAGRSPARRAGPSAHP